MGRALGERAIRIGGASGFWGESDSGLPQLLDRGQCDYIIFDYLAEVTMSILARAKAKDASLGYATDFVTAAVRPHLRQIASGGVKLLSNAGGTNPQSCAEAIRAAVRDAGLDLKVAAVTGDDLTQRAAGFTDTREMFSSDAFPDAERIASINAYTGAFPIAAALAAGADIVVTGRCVDSALTLAACIHEFGWGRQDWDLLAAGSLAGHLIECGPQASGGNFTDWEDVKGGQADIGYPIAILSADGAASVTKPEGTFGMVTRATVCEQMLYEIGDPQSYLLPDVICDFSHVEIEQMAPDQVRVTGAKGRGAPDHYKASATYADGHRIQTQWYFIGEDAAKKAETFSNAAFERARRKLARSNLGEFTETLVETIGNGSQFGAFATEAEKGTRELALKIGARHPDPRALGILLREATGLALSAPPGLTMFTGGRASPSPVVRLFSLLVPKSEVEIAVDLDGKPVEYSEQWVAQEAAMTSPHDGPEKPPGDGAVSSVPLRQIAWGRSGDKGNKANVGIIARRPEFAPYIWSALTTGAVAKRFAHFLEQPDRAGSVERFYLPGTRSMNFLLHDCLGGGGMASLRADPQGKSYAQILLDTPVSVPTALLEGMD